MSKRKKIVLVFLFVVAIFAVLFVFQLNKSLFKKNIHGTDYDKSIVTLTCYDDGVDDKKIPCHSDEDCAKEKMNKYCQPKRVDFPKCGNINFCGNDGYCRHDCNEYQKSDFGK